jgi:ankyrin repeat protein
LWLTIVRSFRWISRRLEILRGSILDLILNASEELGTARDETFEQTLQDIPEEKSQDVLLLFQSMVAACRPLSHEELAEIFSTHSAPYNTTLIYKFPALIVIDEKRDHKVVRLSSHFVKEFLTSNRLRTSNFREISRYYIDEEDANAILSRVCIGVLLRLEKWMDKNNLENVALALYAGHYWVRHTQFGKVASQNLEIMKDLFDPRNSHLEAWIRMQDIEKSQSRSIDDLTLHPSTLEATPLYYAALWGFSDLISYLVKVLPEDLKDKRGYHGTPLHAASYRGHRDAALVLLASGADVNAKANDTTPLHAAYYGGHLEAMRSLLQHGADVNARDTLHDTLLHRASRDGQPQVIDILINHSADVNARNRNNWTPLHWAALRGQPAVTRYLLDKGATVNSQSLNENTPLHFASITGNLEVVEVLLKNGADVRIKGERGWTPLEAARANGHDTIAGLLSTSDDGSLRLKTHKKERKPIKRRALLVGITYSSESNTWPQLDDPHHDVDRYQKLLISA